MDKLTAFLLESNHIERIEGVRPEEITAAKVFLASGKLSIPAIEMYLSVAQPGAILRDRAGLDVVVGNHHPLQGSPHVKLLLSRLLKQINAGELNPFHAHVAYESLHPFTDGNGRSGRLIWLWQMGSSPLGFLHRFYYQTLRYSHK